MLWLELLVLCEAAGDLALATLNCVYFGHYATLARTQSRRVAAFSLALVNAGFALEAGLYIVVAGGLTGSSTRVAAEVVVRSTLLAAAAFVSLLVCRSGPLRR